MERREDAEREFKPLAGKIKVTLNAPPVEDITEQEMEDLARYIERKLNMICE